MSIAKHILIISYTFPPSPGIGGRRWAKFAKYLSRKGYTVHVITANSGERMSSEWTKDVNDPNIFLYHLPVKYPAVLSKFPLSFIEKIEYRLWMIFFRFYSKGTLFDRSVFWKSQLLKKSEELIGRFAIKNVIVTIPPYKLAHHCVSIKRRNRFVNLVVDYRDPWSDNKSFHGFKDLAAGRLNYEIGLENEVLKHADKIITVSDEMSRKLKDRNITDPDKIITVNNGFDEEDLPGLQNIQKKKEGFSFVYAGSLYSNLEYVIEPLLRNLKRLQEQNPDLYSKLKFDFYGNHDVRLGNSIKESKIDIISVHGQIPLASVYEKIALSDYCLLFSAPDHSFAFNTKFFEYLACRKRILLFSNLGKTSEFLENHKLGYIVEPSDFDRSFDAFLNQLLANSLYFNSEFDIAPFSAKALTEEIERILI